MWENVRGEYINVIFSEWIVYQWAIQNFLSFKEVNGLIEDVILDSPPGTKFQCERIGYFCVDLDSTPRKV